MAMRIPLARHVLASKRFTSSKATARAFDDLKVSTLGNGVVVGSQDTNDAFATISVVINAGSRHETHATAGAAAHLKAAAFQSSQDYTAFALTREVEAFGGKVSVSSTRDTITYSIVAPRSHQHIAAKIIASAATKQLLQPWEVREQDERLAAVVSHASDAEVAFDAAHQLAFRTTLGRPSLLAKHQVGHVCVEAIKHFLNERLVGPQVSVAATGVEHAFVKDAFSSLLAHLPSNDVHTVAAKYHAGGHYESRTLTASHNVTALLAFNGAALGSADSAVSQLLPVLLANPASVELGNSSSVVGSALAKAGLSATASDFVFSYSDASLFGVKIVADASSAHQAVVTTANTIRGVVMGGVSEQLLNRAKAQLSVKLLSQNSFERANFIGLQLARTRAALTPEQAAANLASVTAEQASKSLGQAAMSLPVYTVVGDIEHAPYLSEFC